MHSSYGSRVDFVAAGRDERSGLGFDFVARCRSFTCFLPSQRRLDASAAMTALPRPPSPAPSSSSTLRSLTLSQPELATTTAKRTPEEVGDAIRRPGEQAHVAELPHDGAIEEETATLSTSESRIWRGVKAVLASLLAQVCPVIRS